MKRSTGWTCWRWRNAAKELWKAGIYAEAAMGCTGPVVKLNKKHEEKALEILKKAGYI